MKHTAAICLYDTVMIRNIPKDRNMPRTASKKVLEDRFTNVIEELGDGDRIRCCSGFTDSRVSGSKMSPENCTPAKIKTRGFRKSEGLIVI
jgi:hypothetical protein